MFGKNKDKGGIHKLGRMLNPLVNEKNNQADRADLDRTSSPDVRDATDRFEAKRDQEVRKVHEQEVQLQNEVESSSRAAWKRVMEVNGWKSKHCNYRAQLAYYVVNAQSYVPSAEFSQSEISEINTLRSYFAKNPRSNTLPALQALASQYPPRSAPRDRVRDRKPLFGLFQSKRAREKSNQSEHNPYLNEYRATPYTSAETASENRGLTERAKDRPRRTRADIIADVFGYSQDTLHGFVPYIKILDAVQSGSSLTDSTIRQMSQQAHGWKIVGRLGASLTAGNMLKDSRKLIAKMESNPDAVNRLHSFFSVQGSAEAYQKYQNILHDLLKDGTLSSKDIRSVLSDFDQSGVLADNPNNIRTEGQVAAGQMGSGSYSSADIARFVANMAKNGGYTDSVPASIEGIGKKIRLDPALLVAFYHGTQTTPDVGLDNYASNARRYGGLPKYTRAPEYKPESAEEKEITPEQEKQLREYLYAVYDDSVEEFCDKYCADLPEGDLISVRAAFLSEEYKEKYIGNLIRLKGMALISHAGGMGVGFSLGTDTGTGLDKFGLSFALTPTSEGIGVVALTYNDSAQIKEHTYMHWGAGASLVPDLKIGGGISLQKYFYDRYESLEQNWGDSVKSTDYLMVGAGISSLGAGAMIELGQSYAYAIQQRKKDVTQALTYSFGTARSAHDITIDALHPKGNTYYGTDAANWIVNSLRGILQNSGYDYASADVKRAMMDKAIVGISEASAQMAAQKVEGKWKLGGVGVSGGKGFVAPYLRFRKIELGYASDLISLTRIEQRKQVLAGLREIWKKPGMNYAQNIAKEWNGDLLDGGTLVTGRLDGNNVVLSATESCTTGIRLIKGGSDTIARSVRFDRTKYRPIVFSIHHAKGQEIPTVRLEPVEPYRIREARVETNLDTLGTRDMLEVVSHLNGLAENASREALVKGAIRLNEPQLVKLLSSSASEHLVSEAFSVVVQQMSESPTYLIEHTTNEQKFRITQRCAIQGHFGILVSHEKFQARDKIEEFLVKVLDGCVEHATDMNDYAMITEAFEDARGLEPLSLLERYPDNKYILDFVASLALGAESKKNWNVADIEKLTHYPEIFRSKLKEKIEANKSLLEKPEVDKVYIIAPSNWYDGDTSRAEGHEHVFARDIAKKHENAEFVQVDGPDDIAKLKGENIALIAIGEPWDMNKMLADSDLSRVRTLFTRTCRGAETWMVDVKGKYPDLVTITNKNVATSYRYNDDIQEALVSGLLDSSKTSWTEVLKGLPDDVDDVVYLPDHEVVRAIRLMDPELFNQNPSLRMSEKYKKGKIKRVPARYVYENTPLIIKDDSVQKMLIKEKGFLLGAVFTRPTETGNDHEDGERQDGEDGEKPDDMDPKPPRNPEPPKPPKPPKPPEGTSERVSSTPQGEAVPANNETGLDGNTSEIGVQPNRTGNQPPDGVDVPDGQAQGF